MPTAPPEDDLSLMRRLLQSARLRGEEERALTRVIAGSKLAWENEALRLENQKLREMIASALAELQSITQ